MPITKPPACYEKRLVLFMDFLGFREIVERTVGDEQFLRRLLHAMAKVGGIAEGNEEFYRSQRITQFSDCIVVSYKVEEESAVFWLLHAIALCIIDLAELGFLLRGALTVGDLLHTRNYVVGPAMVKAYELESRHAKYPRILVDEEVLRVARSARNEIHAPSEEAAYVKHFMTKDADGSYFVDYISWQAVVEIAGGGDEFYPHYLKRIGEIIANGLKYKDPRILEKYLWVYNRYIAAIKQFERLPKAHRYRRANSESCAAIEALPRMAQSATAARALVQRSARADRRRRA